MKNKSIIPAYGSPEWRYYQYEQQLNARRGHNYEYWDDKKHWKMLDDGWQLYNFDNLKRDAIKSESVAKDAVAKLKSEGNYARIVCGLVKTVQRVKYYSIIYKQKQTK